MESNEDLLMKVCRLISDSNGEYELGKFNAQGTGLFTDLHVGKDRNTFALHRDVLVPEKAFPLIYVDMDEFLNGRGSCISYQDPGIKIDVSYLNEVIGEVEVMEGGSMGKVCDLKDAVIKRILSIENPENRIDAFVHLIRCFAIGITGYYARRLHVRVKPRAKELYLEKVRLEQIVNARNREIQDLKTLGEKAKGALGRLDEAKKELERLRQELESASAKNKS